MKSNEYVMPELRGIFRKRRAVNIENGDTTNIDEVVVLSKDTFIHLIHTLRNQRFIETKPVNEQKKRQDIIDKTYDWMLGIVDVTIEHDTENT